MKRSRLPTQTAKNASKLHKKVGEILTSETSPYRFYEIRQEYQVSQVNPSYESNRERFDWCIINLKIAIEVHGEQHYRPVCFGGISMDEAKENFKRRQILDEEKQRAAKAAGWAYVVIKYDETNLDLTELNNKFLDAVEEVTGVKQKPQKPFRQKIPSRRGHKWPSKKIPSRPFPKAG